MSDVRAPIVFGVEGGHGHQFDGSPESTEDPFEWIVPCLTCGARYLAVTRDADRTPPADPDDPWYVTVRYETWSGDAPEWCSSDTSRVHGDAPCEADNGRPCTGDGDEEGWCSHVTHACNCLMCTG